MRCIAGERPAVAESHDLITRINTSRDARCLATFHGASEKGGSVGHILCY